MSNKHLFFLTGVAFILLVILFGEPFMQRIGLKKDAVIFDGLETSDITEVVLTKQGNDTITLKKVDDVWTVNGLEGSFEIDTFIENLVSAPLTALASKVVENHDLFEVTEEKGTIVTIRTNDNLEKLAIFGKSTSKPNTIYVRIPTADAVYESTTPIRAQLLHEVNDWRNKLILQVNEDDVASVIVENGSNSYSISKGNESLWNLQYKNVSATVSKSAQNNLFTALLRLEASNFDTTVQPEAIKSNTDSRITISLNNNTKSELWLQKKGDVWLVVINDKPYVYTFNTSSLQYVLVDPQTLAS